MTKNRIFFTILCFLFIIVNTYVISDDKYWTLAIPFLLWIIFLAVFQPNSLLWWVTLLTPLSTSLKELGIYSPIGIEMALPTEPILCVLMIITWIKMLSESHLFIRLYSHPISWCILAYLSWLFFTTFSSVMPLVSFKLFINRLWFISSFYVLAFVWFQEKSSIYSFIKCYLFGLSIVALYTIFQHSLLGFEHEAAHWVMSPFFKDHTSYGMSLSLILPFSIYMFTFGHSFNEKVLYALILILIICAIIFSYTRASWLSIISAVLVYFIIKSRIRFSVLLLSISILLSFLIFFQSNLLMMMKKNSQDSSDSFTEHIESMSNISTDASNLERINRWKSAIRLFKERPHLGWGAGTYQFKYSAYQNYYDKTIISTNSGNKGNAHSEYLSILSENGWPGLLIFLLFICVVFMRAILLYSKLHETKDKNLVMACIFSLVTYFTHGLLNNFLDMDKASVPIWAIISILVVIDLKHPKNEIQEKNF